MIDLRRRVYMKPNMDENFSKLQESVLDSLEKTDLIEVKQILSSIKEPTLVSGVGGSSVVSTFLSKVLSEKNNIICENITARDANYKNLKGYKNIIACSYSGNNLGVTTALKNLPNKYLLSGSRKDGVTNICYSAEDKERSFISLSSTLIPMCIALAYYTDNDLGLIQEIFNSNSEVRLEDTNIYEVLTGYETSTASKFLESTLTESGIGIPIIHDKYEYCHGRSTLGYHNSSNLIFFHTDSKLDQFYDAIMGDYYRNIIKFDKKYDDNIINDFYFTHVSMHLCKQIAEQKQKDLSIVEYSPLVKKLYHYEGEM